MDQAPALPPALWIPTTVLIVAMGFLIRCGRGGEPGQVEAATSEAATGEGATGEGAGSPERSETPAAQPRVTAPPAASPRRPEETSRPPLESDPGPGASAATAPIPRPAPGLATDSPAPTDPERRPAAAAEPPPRTFWQPSALDLERRVQLIEQDSFVAESLALLRRARQSSQVGHDYTWIDTTRRPFLLMSREPAVDARILGWCDELVQLAMRLESAWLRPLGHPALVQPFALVVVSEAAGMPELQCVESDGESWLLLSGVPHDADRVMAAAHFLRRSVQPGGDDLPWWLLLGLAQWLDPEPTRLLRGEVHVRLGDLVAVEGPDALGGRMAALQSILDQAAYRAAFLHAAGSFVEFCMDEGSEAPRREVLLDWAVLRCNGLADPRAERLVDGLGFTDLDALEQAWLDTLPVRERTPR